MSRATKLRLEMHESIGALAVAARPGRCEECGHASTVPVQQPLGARLFQHTPQPAACSQALDEEDWAAAGGIGPITRCGCEGAFHGS